MIFSYPAILGDELDAGTLHGTIRPAAICKIKLAASRPIAMRSDPLNKMYVPVAPRTKEPTLKAHASVTALVPRL